MIAIGNRSVMHELTASRNNPMDPQNVPATAATGAVAGDIRILINEVRAGLAATVKISSIS